MLIRRHVCWYKHRLAVHRLFSFVFVQVFWMRLEVNHCKLCGEVSPKKGENRRTQCRVWTMTDIQKCWKWRSSSPLVVILEKRFLHPHVGTSQCPHKLLLSTTLPLLLLFSQQIHYHNFLSCRWVCCYQNPSTVSCRLLDVLVNIHVTEGINKPLKLMTADWRPLRDGENSWH